MEAFYVFLVAAAVLVAVVVTGNRLMDKHYSTWEDTKRGEKWGWAVQIGVVLLYIAVFVGGCNSVVQTSYYYSGEYECRYGEKSSQIYSIKTSGETSGLFFLGTGYINERQYYYFYRAENGGMVLDKVRVEEAILYETTGTPHITDGGMWCDKWVKGELQTRNVRFTSHENSYAIYIPRGTVTEKVNPFSL